MRYRDASEKHRHLGIERTEADDLLSMHDRFVAPAGEGEAVAKVAVGRGRRGVEIDRPAERSKRLLGAAFHHRRVAECDLPPLIELIERNCAHDVPAPRLQSFVALDPSIVRGKYQAKPEQA